MSPLSTVHMVPFTFESCPNVILINSSKVVYFRLNVKVTGYYKCCGFFQLLVYVIIVDTIIHVLWYTNCDTRTVIHDLWYMNCDTRTVIHEMWYTNCDTRTVIYELWYTNCGTWTVIHDFWYMNCDTWNVVHEL